MSVERQSTYVPTEYACPHCWRRTNQTPGAWHRCKRCGARVPGDEMVELEENDER